MSGAPISLNSLQGKQSGGGGASDLQTKKSNPFTLCRAEGRLPSPHRRLMSRSVVHYSVIKCISRKGLLHFLKAQRPGRVCSGMRFAAGTCDGGEHPALTPPVGSEPTMKEIKTFLTASPLNRLQFIHVHHETRFA